MEVYAICDITGSPPPMRGKVDQKQLPIDANGITPAYAGKSSARNEKLDCSKDHPRLCGEKVIVLQSQQPY